MSGEDAPADAAPPSAVPTTPVSAASNGGGSAKKRLLPMELRRRRRAAKLQITEERNVATISASAIIAGINDSHTPDDAVPTDPAPTDTTNAHASSPPQEKSSSAAPPPPGASIEPTERATEQVQQPDETPLSSRESATPGQGSATKRLQNLFSFSILDRKRQKLQHRESLVEVPTYMKLNHVPLDVALKSKVVISMSFSFPFTRPRAASIAAAAANQASDVPEVRWLQALRYYAHPASSLPSSLNATNDRQLEESEFYVNRFRVWQESFRHAYVAFRRFARDGTLYVRYPEFVACFFIDDGKAEAGTREPSILDLCANFTMQREPENEEKPNHDQKRLRAVISQSNARLRKELHRRGVEFNVPFNLRALQKPVTGLELNDSDLTGHSIPASGTDQSVHGPDSLLHFSGHHAVHGLYEFLLNRKPHSNQDVPEIIAPHPFTNASIRSIGVRFMGKTSGRGVGEDSTSSGQATTIRSEVELSGFCLPFVIENLIRCLEDSQKAEGLPEMAIKAALETAPMCERLNAIFLDDNKMSVMSASRVGREREEWKQQLDFAKRRLQSVKHGGSNSIEIEMATR